jgi:drug/metabolite transporter (DMT)-like permease
MSIIGAGFDGIIALPNTANLHWVAVISVGGLTAHFCITTALTLAPASIVAPLEFLRLPLIAVIGYFVYAEALSLFILGGAILIIGANIANLRKAETG